MESWPSTSAYMTQTESDIPLDVTIVSSRALGQRVQMMLSGSDLLMEGDDGRCYRIAEKVSEDFVDAAVAVAGKQVAGPAYLEDITALVQDHGHNQAGFAADYRRRSDAAAKLRQDARRASFQVIQIDHLPPAVSSDQLQRWDERYTDTDWIQANEIAASYLKNGGDPLDAAAARAYALQHGSDEAVAGWAASLFRDSICYSPDQPDMFANGRHRSLAMRQAGCKYTVAELDGTPERRSADTQGDALIAGCNGRPVVQELEVAAKLADTSTVDQPTMGL